MDPRRYETLLLLHPELSVEELDQVKKKFIDIMDEMGGRLLRLDDWGHRKLAYTVKKQLRGLYFLMDFMGRPELMLELERNMRIDERVFKYMTTVLDKSFNEEKYKIEMERLEAEKTEREAKAAAAAESLEAEPEEALEEAGLAEEPAEPEAPVDEAKPEQEAEAPSAETEETPAEAGLAEEPAEPEAPADEAKPEQEAEAPSAEAEAQFESALEKPDDSEAGIDTPSD